MRATESTITAGQNFHSASFFNKFWNKSIMNLNLMVFIDKIIYLK